MPTTARQGSREMNAELVRSQEPISSLCDGGGVPLMHWVQWEGLPWQQYPFQFHLSVNALRNPLSKKGHISYH
jgi:hypothetical protein